MRALALLLIVVNLAYLGWATLIDVRSSTPRGATAEIDPDVQRIILAAERSAATSAAAARSQQTKNEKNGRGETVSAGSSADTKSRCVSIGPFQDLTSAAQASATLQSSGQESKQRLEQGELWVGYWVHIPGYSKREDAEHAVARLNQNGITDVYISLSTADAASSNVVSLGVFKDAERAQKLLAEAKNLGFAAQVTDRTRSGSVYWVDVDVVGAKPNFDYSTLGALPGKILRLEQRPCPSPAK
jgi:cell division septation protein DedD